MKVAIVNTKRDGGGAAIASFRLYKALQANGVEVSFVTVDDSGDDANVVSITNTILKKAVYKIYFLLERLFIWTANKFSRKNLFALDCAKVGFDITKLPQIEQADIIHLHWINQGMLSLKSIKRLVATGKPIVITAHDMWYMTSLCHHSAQCDRYTCECKNCPMLVTSAQNDLSNRVWQVKNGLYADNVVFVALSKWIEGCMQRSALTSKSKTVEIPNVIETDIFYSRNREEERKRLGILPTETALIFGAAKLNDPIKGADMLFEAVAKSDIKDNLVLILFGNIKNDAAFLDRIPCKYIYMGSISEKDDMACLYSAADITVLPSHYETFSLVTAESLLCGTPVVAFNNSASASLIEHKQTGYLAQYPNIDDFKSGIEWLAQNISADMRKAASDEMRIKVSPDSVVQQHINLYNSLLKK